jgi:cytochrome c
MTIKVTDMEKIFLAPIFLLSAFMTQPCFAEGNAKDGSAVFVEECSDCHSSVPGKNKRGPTLVGVIGRKAGSVADFSGYSDAMKQADWFWTADKLDGYISAPKKIVPGGRMKYDGLADAKARNDVIAYLSSLKK